jgi:hypothetical protein
VGGMARWTAMALIGVAALVACSSPARPHATVGTRPSSALLSPSPSSSPSPEPSPTPSAPHLQPAATAAAVAFQGLPEGQFPVHLHSMCSGSASFHIAVIGTLSVGMGGTGSIQVPLTDFNRGLCLIVYTSSSLSTVLTTRRI